MAVKTRTLEAKAVAALCWGLSLTSPSQADTSDEVTELRRAIDVLRAENRALAERLGALEARKAAQPDAQQSKAIEGNASMAAGHDKPALPLERRVEELEIAKDAQADAVRRIIRDSVSTLGSKINDVASLSGTLGVSMARRTDFQGERKSTIGLSAADLELTIQTNEWTMGQIKLEYTDGKDVQFLTNTDRHAGVDRLSVDTAFISVGNQQRFPPQLTAGRMVVPFGISTGHPLADALSVGSPLTVDVFEMRQSAVALNLAFPTPALKPATPPVRVPVVRPVAVAPLMGAIARGLGYEPLPAPSALPATSPQPTEHAPFNAGLYVFESATPGGLRKHVGGTVGLSTKGHCGRDYESMSGFGLCPWALQVDVGYNSSVFGSRFLETEYAEFLDQIGHVPAMSASVKANMGPFALVGEWNGARRKARFTDDLGRAVAVKPSAWQVSLGYQFDWNPWVQEIGAQGTYLALGYSVSRDLAGASRLVNGEGVRVGMVPRKRLLLTAGEWVMEGLRLTLEYAKEWDYSLIEGGTGQHSRGFVTTLTYAW